MFDDLLKILVSGQQQGEESQDNPLGDLLKVVLGGQGGSGEGQSPTEGQQSGGLADILQVVLGGQGQVGSEKEGDEAAAATSPLVTTIARLLSEKLKPLARNGPNGRQFGLDIGLVPTTKARGNPRPDQSAVTPIACPKWGGPAVGPTDGDESEGRGRDPATNHHTPDRAKSPACPHRPGWQRGETRQTSQI